MNTENNINTNEKNTVKSVEDFEILTLSFSGMRIMDEYELLSKGEQTEISYYTVLYSDGQDKRVLRKRAFCETCAVVEALNSFGFMGWNGFCGKHPVGVLDGRMFKLSAKVNGGNNLYASGSENFPENFHKFEQWLYEALKSSEEIVEETDSKV